MDDDDARHTSRAVLPPPPPRQTYTREARDTLADSGFRHVVSAHELKASLLALGTVFPGAISLVAALLAHSPISSEAAMLAEPWKREYSKGLQQEMYAVDLRDVFLKAMGGDDDGDLDYEVWHAGTRDDVAHTEWRHEQLE